MTNKINNVQMILSIIIPVYNEEKTVIEILKKIKDNQSNLFNMKL